MSLYIKKRISIYIFENKKNCEYNYTNCEEEIA